MCKLLLWLGYNTFSLCFFSRSLFLIYALISRSQRFVSLFPNERHRYRKSVKKSLSICSERNRAQFGKCVCCSSERAGIDCWFSLRRNVTLFKLWKVIYYSDHNKREFPSFPFFRTLHFIFFSLHSFREICIYLRMFHRMHMYTFVCALMFSIFFSC